MCIAARFLFAGLCAAVALLGAVAGVRAQAYPSKPITIVCAQPPGSGPDTMLRLFAAVMARNMNVPVLVVN